MNYYAQIEWKDDIPFNTQFDDIYFSTISGIAETRYIFIQHNDLYNRFQNTRDNEIFIIAETGFGSGLNFLTTLKLWQETANPKAQLFFISFEQHPLTPNDLAKIMANFPELTTQTNELLSQYYLPTPATHRLKFKHNAFLHLVIGDINSTITEQKFIADAWFLDGFTPNKNTTIWNEHVIKNIRRLSSGTILEQIQNMFEYSTSFATFTANSQVRKLLAQYGFNVKKDKGYNKREMLFGELSTNSTLIKEKSRPRNWFNRYTNTNNSRHVIVIGGGLAGASTAYSLANRGYTVTLYEAESQLASGSSGNSQGMLYGSFSGNYTPILELSLAGYRYSHWLINKLLELKVDYDNCGIIQLDYNDKIKKQHQQILNANLPPDLCRFVNHKEISTIAGLNLQQTCSTPLQNSNLTEYTGLFFPYGLWLDPGKLVHKMVDHPNITVRTGINITELVQLEDETWQITDSTGNIDYAANIVLCNSYMATKFTQLSKLHLRKIRGQISIIPQKTKLQTVLCNNGYVTPNTGDSYIIGATFKLEDHDTDVKMDEHIENIQNFADVIPDIIQDIDISQVRGKVSFRSSTTDYMPIVGPIADYNKFNEIYRDLAKDSNYWINDSCPYLKGLFINIAHGAKGILTAPVCGEIIADYIDNTPFAISESLREGLHPNRFWKNNIVKCKSLS